MLSSWFKCSITDLAVSARLICGKKSARGIDSGVHAAWTARLAQCSHWQFVSPCSRISATA
jgi:hypothetical protein